jgi:lipopolysaccharide export system protein LptA
MGRQTVTALGTLVALAVAFLGYEQTLGRLTDFEPIDVALLEPLPVTDEPQHISRPEDEIAAERAFGPLEGAKLKLLKMYQVPKAAFSDSPRGRGLGVFIFFQDYKLAHNDDRKLVEFMNVRMIYITGSVYGDGSTDDIYTLESDQAVIRFDRDVELRASTNAKPLAGWVEGNVRLRSNQGSAARDDDIKVLTARLDYEKLRNMIWSEKLVQVIGEDGMRIAGVGMEIELAPEQPQPPAGTVVAKKKKAADVEKLRLLDQVDFHLMVEGEGHVLGGLGGASAAAGPTKPTTPIAAKPKEKAPLDVRARGPFNYDLKRLVATFEKAVEVERQNPGDAKSDRLLCETLRLQFAEKPDEKPATLAAAKAANGAKRTAQQKTSLSTVEAFGPAGTVVVIAESQKLRATGDHLFHDAVKRRTRLESKQKMVVLQDNVRIEGKSLLVVQDAAAGPNGKSGFSEALVEGPNGLFEVVEIEFQGPTPAKELVVRFNKTLRATPEKNGKNRMVDVDGGVELEIPKQPLLMTSEVLHVRLEEAADAKADLNAATTSKMEPTWLMAERSVNVSSPELDVTAGQSLTMHILPGEGKLGVVEEAPPEVADAAIKPVDFVVLPDDAAPAKPSAIAAATTQVLKPNDDGPQTPVAMKRPEDPTARPQADRKAAPAKKPGGFNLGLGRDKTRDPSKPPDKVDLRAETVEVFAVKVDGKTEARRAEAVGNVYIRRDAVKSPDDAVEIKGEKADFFRSPKGDRMIVHGGKRPAEIINKKFHLAECRHIDLDEGANMMIVTGAGKLTLVGAPLVNATDAPKNVRASDKPFVVTWSNKMEFNGLNAYFNGDVVTKQSSQRAEPIEEFVEQDVACRIMTVYFKDRLSFKGAKTEAGKKMEVLKVVCDRDVKATESIFHPPPGKEPAKYLFRYSGIQASYLTFDNVRRQVDASGTDSHAVFFERNKPTTNADGSVVPPALPFIRTNAEFGKLVYRQDDKVVDLYSDVRTIRSPVQHGREELNRDHLRPEAMAVDGDFVQLQERTDAEGRKLHDFKAMKNVVLHTKDHKGFGDEATYDQSRDRFVLKGAPAMLQKVDKPGLESPASSAEEIEYHIKSGHVIVHGGGRAPNLNIGDGFKAKGKGVPVKGARPK